RTRTTSGAPVGRWRARRQEALSSRSGRTMRERRAARGHRTSASGNGSGNGNGSWSGVSRRRTDRRTTPPSSPGASA
ncbi:MAG TPA: hypothetical protein VHY81_00940, partial [Acidimicrobiales bacterium]|nr:hypothetical protein [Acidimicrobiales bacterium]